MKLSPAIRNALLLRPRLPLLPLAVAGDLNEAMKRLHTPKEQP